MLYYRLEVSKSTLKSGSYRENVWFKPGDTRSYRFLTQKECNKIGPCFLAGKPVSESWPVLRQQNCPNGYTKQELVKHKNNMSQLIRNLTVLCLAALLGACTTSDSVPMAPPAVADTGIYKIGVGDMLTVSVWGNPDLSLSVPVRPDGYISMPLVGDIQASGSDAETLSAAITEVLSAQLRNPQVTVIVSGVNSIQYSSRVRVTGAVRAQQSLQFAPGMSVLDAILEAGGLNEVAAANRAKLYRTVDGKLMEFDVRLDDILLRGELTTNYQIQPGDVITVPERLF